MRVLMISRDRNTITAGTPAFARMGKYRSLVSSLDIHMPSLRLLWPSKKYDLVTCQDPFETGLFAWIIARLYDAKLELQVHTDFLSLRFANESLKNKIRVMLARFLLPRADCVRVVSKRIKDRLQATNYKLQAAPIVLPIFTEVADAVPTATADLHKKYPQFDTIFLMASRITREKNIGMAIEAMAEIIKTHPRAGLVIVGNGPECEALKLIAHSLKLEAHVVFESWNNNLGSYYTSADAFLVTSNYEGYGLTLVEAASTRCPIITTDVGVVGDLITDDFALIVPVGDVDRFARALRFFIEDSKWSSDARQRLEGFRAQLPNEQAYLELLKKAWTTCGGVPEL